MAYITKKPTGLSIKRSGATFIATWKIGDKDYGAGQTFQYRLLTWKWGKWNDVQVNGGSTKKSIALTASDYYPSTKTVLKAIQIRIRGKRRPFEGKTPTVSEWSVKAYDILIPNRPKVSLALSSESDNVCTFSWETVVASDSTKWFSRVRCQSVLVEECGITDGSKVSGWTDLSATGASSSVTITEDTSVINNGLSHTRWFRVRAQGPQGNTAWSYTKHVYAVPYQTKNVEASTSETDAGGSLCQATWQTQRSAAHPVDSINVQYAFAVPDAGMTCPDNASWTDGQTFAYRDGTDAAAFSIDSVVGNDQCMFVRINTVHDRDTTYGYPVFGAVGPLLAPASLSVQLDDSTHMATVTVAHGSAVSDSFIVIRYLTEDDPDGYDIGIVPHGQTSVVIQCPEYSSANDIRFAAYSAVGTYEATTRADGSSSYAVTAHMISGLIYYGGTVPAAPQTVTLAKTNTPGTIRVAWDWSWDQAVAAELSWADHDDAWESTEEPDTYMVNRTHISAWNISGLDTGVTWYVRVRLVAGVGDSQTFGAYSTIVSIDLSSAPAIPILTLSEGVIPEDGTVTASWAFSSGDGTGQASAEVAEVTTSGGVTTYTTLALVESAQHVSISAADAGWTEGETHSIVVRVTSVSGRQSDGWSDPVSIIVAPTMVATISGTSLLQQTVTEDGVTRLIYALTVMPLTVIVTGAGTGGTTSVVIERTEDYHVDRPDESEFNGFANETIAMRTQVGEDAIVFSNDNLIGSLDDGATYRIIATVADGLGQTASVQQGFEVRWTHQALMPSGTVEIDGNNLIAVITPEAPVEADETDVCDIYRLSADKPELIYPGATFGADYVDPYPAIGTFGGYRLVFRTANGDYITEDSELAWIDIEAGLETDHSIIDFGSGRVFVDYNIDLSNAWAKDFTETKYLGGSVQGDWNPAVSRTGTVSTVVPTDDEDTIRMMRRLAAYAGVCHVRSHDGSSYTADVQVSESIRQDSGHMIIEFSLAITRVDAESYDGMTKDAWEEANGVE